MPTRKSVTPKLSEGDAKSRILAAAAEVFATIGFGAARVDDIAARAGVNKAMLYYHVGDKEQLYATILTETIDRVPPALRKALENVDTPAEKLRCVLETLASFGTNHPHFVPIMLREIASGGAALPDEMLVRMAGIFRVVGDVLNEGMEAGEFRHVDPLLTHVTLVGSMIFLVASQPVRERIAKIAGVPQQHSLDDLASHTYNLVLHGLETDAPPKPKKKPRSRK